MSTIQSIVLDAVCLLPHPSVAVKVRVFVRIHPNSKTGLSEYSTETFPQLSSALAVPRDCSREKLSGLHPACNDAPYRFSTGGIVSMIQCTVLDVLLTLPHESWEVNVLVCDLSHPFSIISESRVFTTGVMQLSVAVALPRALSMELKEGLHPRSSVVPVARSIGASVSRVQ